MENSGKILSADQSPQWFVAIGEKWLGPLSVSDIFEKIRLNQITVAHYAWKKGQSGWKRICDLKAFQSGVPHSPGKKLPSEKVPEIRGSERAQKKIWYVYLQQSQYGPFSGEEIERYLKVGKLNERCYVWKEGMSNWQILGQVSEFSNLKLPPSGKSNSQAPSKPTDQRENPRRPLVAKIMMTDEQSVIVGVCRDISTGGLQVLTEKVPAPVGARLRMNISPSSNEIGHRIEPFVAEGVIVRILEDGRGFSFRFEPLNENAKRAIESFISSPQ